ncbi:solute carrier family 2, facilitated glucose transporter member 11-like, partial [Meleagris gallopavo]|uniref:solute carrier family 2, facilitated glucose transporter member 11-like n=1 Tax=Meleagris gallopavo TaxID=9103 RepID=UPI00093F80F8
MLAEQAAAKGQRAKKPWELFRNPAVRWQLISIIVLSSAMQLCGNDSMYFYAAYVFQEAGIPQDTIPYVVIGTGSCELITSVTCNMIIDYAGRRPLLLGGYILMAGWATVFMVALSQQVINFNGLFKRNAIGLCFLCDWGVERWPVTVSALIGF